MTINIKELTGCSQSDIDGLEKYLKLAGLFGIDTQDIQEDLEGGGLNTTDIRQWYYGAMSYVAFSVTGNVENYLYDKLVKSEITKIGNELISLFGGFHINGKNSYFNSFLDDLDYYQSDDALVLDVLKLLKDNKNVGNLVRKII